MVMEIPPKPIAKRQFAEPGTMVMKCVVTRMGESTIPLGCFCWTLFLML